MVRLLVVAAMLTAPVVARADGIPPHASWGTLSWSNGVAAGAYDTAARRLRSFREHLFARLDEHTATRELAYDAYFGLRAGGQNVWLPARPLAEAGYEGDTGMARIVQTHAEVRATQWFFSPFATDAAAIAMVIEVENTGDAPLVDAAVFSLQNVRVGGGEGTSSESIAWIGDAYEERGERGLIVHRALPAPSVRACSPGNPYQSVLDGARLTAGTESGTRDDAVAGFEWDLAGLAPGQRRTFAVVLAHRGDGDRRALDAALSPLAGAPAALLEAERAGWAAFHARAAEPAGMSADERAVYRRQLAVLRMAQVREAGRGRGQIVASLPPGQWNISWVRDQAYAVTGLVRAGLHDEATQALRFVLGADAGRYVCCDRDGGPWVGVPYAISVVRYLGDGTEESDWNDRGPNIEFDGFGLVLANLADLVTTTGDDALVRDHAAAIFERTADVLVGLIESDTGLVRADSSIWETHWYDGGRRHHAYTQATTVHGLRAASLLADRVGRAEDAVRYRAAADRVATAIAARMVDPTTQVLRSSLEETTRHLDAAGIEAFNWDVLPAGGAVARATLDAFRAGLWNGAVGHGYRRNDDGGDYDRREWIVVDLRIAQALRRAGRAAEADALIAWITDQARLNFDLVPENYDRTTGDYQGEVPMVGFGAGAYVTALWERGPGSGQPGSPDAGPDAPDAGAPDAGPGAPPADGDGDGCGCASSQAPAAWLAVATLAALRRRRRR
jgi:MYXO-CTERM domain-containing protein